MGGRACPCAGGMGGQGCREPTLGGCTDHRWAFMPRAPVSLPLTCLEVSVPPWLVPASCPRGGRARSPRGQAVLGSVRRARGPRQTDGPIVQRVGSVRQPGGGRHRGQAGGPQWPELVLSPALSHTAGGNAGPGRAAPHPLGHQGAAAAGAGAGRGGTGIQALPPGARQQPTGRQGELAAVSPAWGWHPAHPLPLPQGTVASMPGPTMAWTDLAGCEGGSSPAPSGLACGRGPIAEFAGCPRGDFAPQHPQQLPAGRSRPRAGPGAWRRSSRQPWLPCPSSSKPSQTWRS